MWQQRQREQQGQLINQGLDPASLAGNEATANFERARTDAYQTALRDASRTGAERQALTFGQNIQARNQPYQELGSMQGLLNMPGFNAANAAQPTNYLGAGMGMGGLGAQQYQAQQNKKGNTMGGLGSLGGGLASLFRSGGNAPVVSGAGSPMDYGTGIGGGFAT
jgi:hypothetical protein